MAETTPPHTLADLETLAQQRLDPAAWAYFAGGAADEHTLRANVAAWAALRLRPRVLRRLSVPRLHTRLLGQDWPTPVMVAPMAHQRLAHPHAERGMAMAAAAQGVGMVLSTLSSDPLEAVAEAVQHTAGRGPLWFQLYGLKDRGWWLELVRRAEAAGFEALVLTVDAPLNGVRDRERQAGFRLPAGLQAESLPALAHGPGMADLLAQAPDWDDVTWLRSQTRLPLLLKGITHPQDAALALTMGVAGLVVSNHGGRVLDTLPPSAQLLPEVSQLVQGRCLLLVDGGLRRGTDIVKALALGADAVLVGRPVLWGLAAQGASGAAQALRWLLDECLATLALCGLDGLDDLNDSILGSKRHKDNDSYL